MLKMGTLGWKWLVPFSGFHQYLTNEKALTGACDWVAGTHFFPISWKVTVSDIQGFCRDSDDTDPNTPCSLIRHSCTFGHLCTCFPVPSVLWCYTFGGISGRGGCRKIKVVQGHAGEAWRLVRSLFQLFHPAHFPHPYLPQHSTYLSIRISIKLYHREGRQQWNKEKRKEKNKWNTCVMPGSKVHSIIVREWKLYAFFCFVFCIHRAHGDSSRAIKPEYNLHLRGSNNRPWSIP